MKIKSRPWASQPPEETQQKIHFPKEITFLLSARIWPDQTPSPKSLSLKFKHYIKKFYQGHRGPTSGWTSATHQEAHTSHNSLGASKLWRGSPFFRRYYLFLFRRYYLSLQRFAHHGLDQQQLLLSTIYRRCQNEPQAVDFGAPAEILRAKSPIERNCGQERIRPRLLISLDRLRFFTIGHFLSGNFRSTANQLTLQRTEGFYWLFSRVFHKNTFFQKQIGGTRLSSALRLVWKNPKRFLILTKFRGSSRHFRFHRFYIADYHWWLAASAKLFPKKVFLKQSSTDILSRLFSQIKFCWAGAQLPHNKL